MDTVGQALVEWDREAFLALNRELQNSALDFLMPVITDIGLGHVQAAIVFLVAVYLAVRAGEIQRGAVRQGLTAAVVTRRSWIAPLLLSYAVGGLAATALKTIPRERPWWYYEKRHASGLDLDVQVRTVPGVYPLKVRGFPSGHTTTTVGMATVLTWLYVRRRYGLWIALALWGLAAVVAFSRMYLASHWPLDVAGGTLLGIASGILSVLVCQRWALAGRARRAGEEHIREAA